MHLLEPRPQPSQLMRWTAPLIAIIATLLVGSGLFLALDLTAVLLEDPTAENREALAILEEMQANGTLPPGYEDWIAGFRRNLGLPTEF